jgi:hypothetical protein
MSFAGGFFSGLTRDDAGGIKYLYSKTHAAVETIPPNVQAPAGFNFTSVGGSSNSWFISNVGTNGTTDIGSVGSISVVGNSGGWFPVTITNAATATNATGTGTGTGTGAGTVNTNFVGTALRQGVDKLTFLRTDFDSVIGVFNVVTNQYIDTYVTNNTRVSQTLERVINSPDILISAGDLGLTPAPEQPIATFTTGPGANWQNNGALNTTPNTTPPNGEWDGPGMIITPQNFWFSKLGPNYWNGLAFLNEKDAQLGWGSFLMWGSYDGTTNDPVAYPSGTSLKDLESQIFGF